MALLLLVVYASAQNGTVKGVINTADGNPAEWVTVVVKGTGKGAVLGLAGKILAFFGSLIAASLPVTGFLIWQGRKKKAKTANREKQNVMVHTKPHAEEKQTS